jgi:lysophospholipase L1-like esterase
MRRIIAIAKTALVILVITLTLDFTICQFLPGDIINENVAAQMLDAGVYDRTVSYQYTYAPNLSRQRKWGSDFYPFASDADGFRTGRCAGTDAVAERDRTIFVIGDSFTDGVGVAFEQTFAGLLACAFRGRGQVVRNLGVEGYGPAIYHRKLRAAAKQLALQPRRVLLFLDISDIYNDAFEYVEEGGQVVRGQPPLRRRIVNFLSRNFLTVAAAEKVRRSLDSRGGSVGITMGRWTIDPELMDAWARRGLDIVSANLDKAVSLCREWACEFTLVVYPWPAQVDAGDRDSIQVSFWRKWASERGVGFINAFEPFFNEPKQDALRKYFITGDIHFTAAGHRLVFDEVWPKFAAP